MQISLSTKQTPNMRTVLSINTIKNTIDGNTDNTFIQKMVKTSLNSIQFTIYPL